AMIHWFHITSEKVPAFLDGKWVDVRGFSEPEEVEFMPPLGKQTVIYTGHPEPVSLPRYIKGLKYCTIKGALYPAKMMELYGQLIETGFGSRDEFIINENTRMPFRELAVKIIRNMPRLAPAYFTDILHEALEKYHDCAGAFKIVVSGKKAGRDQTITYDLMASNVAYSTALPAVIAVQALLDGKVKQTGVMAPEGALDAKMFLEAMAKDATIWETVIVAKDSITFD
ncbi:MAG: saccharopine dehydrogenase C-terminal domain-containing protein, partial [Dehalococcoidia bacterium]|nr:saccharopine dehydrogenase C-terminal domain-containing protein [Dehalococcoidia bacterium]